VTVPGVSASGTSGVAGVTTTATRFELSSPVSTTEKQKLVRLVQDSFKQAGQEFSTAQVEQLLKDVDSQFELLFIEALIDRKAKYGEITPKNGIFFLNEIYSFVKSVTSLSLAQISSNMQNLRGEKLPTVFADRPKAIEAVSGFIFDITPYFQKTFNHNKPIDQDFVTALVSERWGDGFDASRITALTEQMNLADQDVSPIIFWKVLDMALQIAQDGSPESKQAGFNLLESITSYVIKHKICFGRQNTLIVISQVDQVMRGAKSIMEDPALKPQYKAIAIQEFVLGMFDIATRYEADFILFKRTEQLLATAYYTGGNYAIYEKDYQALERKIIDGLDAAYASEGPMLFPRAAARAFAYQWVAEQGKEMSAEQLQMVDNTLTTPEACDFFITKTLYLGDASLADIRGSISLEDILQTRVLTSDWRKTYTTDNELYFALYAAFKIPEKKLEAFCRQTNLPITDEMRSAVASLATASQCDMFLDILPSLADPQLRQPGAIDSDEKMQAFITLLLTNIKKVKGEVAPEDFQAEYQEIYINTYAHIIIFPPCVVFTQKTGEGQSIEELEALIAPLTPDQRNIFLNIVQSIDLTELAKSAPTLRLADIIAFCQNPEKLAKLAAITDPKKQSDYIYDELFADVDRKTLTYSAELFGDSYGIFSASAKLTTPTVKGFALSLSGTRQELKMPLFGNGSDEPYRSTTQTATAMVSRAFRFERAGTTTPGIGFQYSNLQDGSSIQTSTITFGVDQLKPITLGSKESDGPTESEESKESTRSNTIYLAGKAYLSPYLNSSFLGINTDISALGYFGVGKGRISPLLAIGFSRTADIYQGQSAYSTNVTPDSLSVPRHEFSATAGTEWEMTQNNSVQLNNSFRYVNELKNGYYFTNALNLSYTRKLPFGLSLSTGGSAFTFAAPGEATTTEFSLTTSLRLDRAVRVGR